MRQILLHTLLLLSIVMAQGQTKWKLDKTHSNIQFTVVHMVVSEVEGNFKDFNAIVESSNDNFDGAKVEFTAQTASIFTDNERRDNHLRSDDFFNAEKYPEVKFSGIIKKEGTDYFLVGSFTMRDVTKEVKFNIKYNGTITLEKGKVAGFKINGKVNRQEYGINFNSALETGGLVVSDEVEINCNVELREVK